MVRCIDCQHLTSKGAPPNYVKLGMVKCAAQHLPTWSFLTAHPRVCGLFVQAGAATVAKRVEFYAVTK